MNLRPTVRIERQPSRQYQLASVIQVLLPAALFILVGAMYFSNLQQLTALEEEAASTATRIAALQKSRTKDGLSRGQRDAVLAQSSMLHTVFGRRTPAAALTLARLEQAFAPSCRARQLTLIRKGSRFRVQLRGKARTAATAAQQIQALQDELDCRMLLSSVKRAKEAWDFTATTLLDPGVLPENNGEEMKSTSGTSTTTAPGPTAAGQTSATTTSRTPSVSTTGEVQR